MYWSGIFQLKINSSLPDSGDFFFFFFFDCAEYFRVGSNPVTGTMFLKLWSTLFTDFKWRHSPNSRVQNSDSVLGYKYILLSHSWFVKRNGELVIHLSHRTSNQNSWRYLTSWEDLHTGGKRSLTINTEIIPFNLDI